MKVEIGFNLSVNGVGNWFTLDDATKGKLDNATYKLAGEVLTDVTSTLREVSVRRGRSRTLERFTAGNASVTLDNRNRYFDPLYGPTIGGTRTNLVTNPNFEVGTAGWIVIGTGSAARTTSDWVFGGASAQVTHGASGFSGLATTFTPLSGNIYAFSVYVRNTAGATRNFYAQIGWSGGTYSTSPTTSVSSVMGWTRLTAIGVAPNSNAANLYVVTAQSSVAGQVSLVDAALVEQSATLNPYFDGTYADSSISVNSQAWNGTANASTSTLVWNSDPGSPYFGSITPRRMIRLSEDGVNLFTGNVEDWAWDYDIGGDSVAIPRAVDGFATLALATATPGTATSQTTGQRIGTVLTQVGWPATDRVISTGAATLDADVVQPNTNALNYIQTVELSEPGAAFIDVNGSFKFLSRTDLQNYSTSSTVFGPSGIPFVDYEAASITEDMKNQVAITWSAGTVVGGTATAFDQTSIDTYGRFSYPASTLLSSSAQAADLASWLVATYKTPTLRFNSVTVALHGLSSSQVAQVLALDLGAPVSVQWTPNNIGSAIAQYVVIDQIEHTATPDSHFVKFTLSQSAAAFVLDSAQFGVLDTNRLGY